MSEHTMATPLYHQRSHSMPVGHAFINNHSMMANGLDNHRTFDLKRSADAQITTNEGFPLPIPKSVSSHFRTSEENKQETEELSFFHHPKTLLNVFDYQKKSCPVILNCKMDRGFFISQSHWTCYRRNYFQVTASFIVPGHTDQSCYALQLYPDKPMQPIQRFFLRLRACTSITPTPPSSTDEISSLENSSVVKPIALTQMTPKRDKGPQREPPVLPITPSDSAFSSEQVCVTFERLQFRVATANNGKRRASQQYFCLIFQLVAQLEDATQHVVSECYSSPLVVRGRSPGHYSTEPQTKDVRKKKKLVSPQQEMLPSPTTSVSQLTKPSPPPMDASPQFMATLPPPPPPPQYVYTPPPMILDARQNNHEQEPPYQPMVPPTMMNSAFSQFHGRSQSANDSDFFARNRLKYQRHDEGGLFDDYHVGIQSALRNWQQQVARQRTDSGTTFDDASSSAYLSSEKQTKSSTPVSYHSGYSQPSMANHWSPRQTHYVEEASPKLYHHHHHQ